MYYLAGILVIPGITKAKFFCLKRVKEVQGTEEKCITWQTSYLSGVLLIESILYSHFHINY